MGDTANHENSAIKLKFYYFLYYLLPRLVNFLYINDHVLSLLLSRNSLQQEMKIIPIILGTAHCLRYIRYISHFWSWHYSYLQVLAVNILTNVTFSIAQYVWMDGPLLQSDVSVLA
jgi:hypothetical protein